MPSLNDSWSLQLQNGWTTIGRRLLQMDQFSETWWVTDCRTLSVLGSFLCNFFEVACHTFILNNQADGFNLFFALAANVISRVGSAKGIKRHSVPFHSSNRSVEGCEQGTGFIQWDMPERRLNISQGKHFGVSNFNSWYWILRALEWSVQRSGIYAKSYSILSRRLVDNGGSTHPVSGLSYFFNNALFLEIFDLSNKFVFADRGISLGAAFDGVTFCFV